MNVADIIKNTDCTCCRPPLNAANFNIVNWGTDTTNGRFADITLEECKVCGVLWFKYLVEYEAFSHSGRWYRGVVTPGQAQILQPGQVVEYLEQLNWYIFGGSYFSSTGAIGKGRLAL